LGGDKTAKGNTGPFLVGSGLAILSALVVFFLVRPLSYDGMKEEDVKVLPRSRFIDEMYLF
jgi:hypothetical protein